jgi:uncharacterized membrane protein YgcG
MSQEYSRLSTSGSGALPSRKQQFTGQWWWAVVCWLLLIGSTVYAQGSYPPARDSYVNDYAGVISQQDVQKIQTMLADLKAQANIHASVLTINSIQDYPTGDETIESFATHLFNTWGIGDKATNKGVLILVAVKDRKVRIELGTGHESRYNTAMKEVIDEYMLPAFKKSEYSRGIYEGTRAVMAKLTGVQPPQSNRAVSPSSIGSAAMVLFIGVIGITIIIILTSAMKHLPGSGGSYGNSYGSSSSFDSGGSPDSGSSFDGGSSSGDGASGSW